MPTLESPGQLNRTLPSFAKVTSISTVIPRGSAMFTVWSLMMSPVMHFLSVVRVTCNFTGIPALTLNSLGEKPFFVT